jgi:hypothetical protein
MESNKLSSSDETSNESFSNEIVVLDEKNKKNKGNINFNNFNEQNDKVNKLTSGIISQIPELDIFQRHVLVQKYKMEMLFIKMAKLV